LKRVDDAKEKQLMHREEVERLREPTAAKELT
jgi:hypothetical protein